MAIKKALSEITFWDVYRAVECSPEEELFHFHENPNNDCPVGGHIHQVLDGKLKQIQDAMEGELVNITLSEVKEDFLTVLKK